MVVWCDGMVVWYGGMVVEGTRELGLAREGCLLVYHLAVCCVCCVCSVCCVLCESVDFGYPNVDILMSLACTKCS